MKALSRLRLIGIMVIVVVIGAGVGVTTDDDSRDWNAAPASEIHERLANAKAAALDRGRAIHALAGAEGASTQTNYDVQLYDIAIRVNDTTEVIYGRVRTVAVAAVANVSSVEVDLFSNMVIDSITAASGTLSFVRAGDVVTITLDATYRVGEQFTFDIWYHGHPTESSGFGAFVFTTFAGLPSISTLSEPYFSRTWWPCKDRMDDKADSFNIAIEVDTSFYVGSNGTLDSVVLNGGNSHTFFYRVRYPMATYLFSMAISDYTVWYDEWVHNDGADTMPLVHAVYPSWYTSSLTSFGVTAGALTIFSEAFGPYPFADEKYGHAHFTWGGAMEHQTMSSMTASSFAMSTTVIVHEMAHQWWGDMITCESWQDIWLNEGWASYAEAIYYEALGGWSSYIGHMNSMAYTAGGTIYCQDTTSTWSIFTSRVYDKGAWALHMLRGVLGDSLFFAGVSAYYESEYKWKAATTEDFKNVFEAATGQELDWFFEEWIHGEYYPNYRWYYTTEPAAGGGYDVFLRIRQIQSSNPLVFTMPVRFTFTGVNDTVKVWVDEREERARIHLDNSISSVQLDPMNWILKAQLRVNWTMFIVSLREDLHAGDQYMSYVDTIETRGGAASKTFTVISGALPAGLTLANTGIISGTPTDTGTFAFTVRAADVGTSYTDQADFVLYVAPNPGMPGDPNNDGAVNVSDVTFLVSYLFQGGASPTVPNSADVDASCTVNVGDITYLVNYLFRSGLTPLPGCVN